MPKDPFKYADEVFEFRASLSRETDRGCALMAAAYLSDQLERLLRQTFVDDQSVAAGLFGPLGPLSSFSVRIDLCYAFGLLPEKARSDLHLIRRVRNDFAHDAKALAFHDPRIAARCGMLYHNVRGTEESPRAQFTGSVMAVCAVVHISTYKATKQHIPFGIEMTMEEKRELGEFTRKLAEDLMREFRQAEDLPKAEPDS